MDFNFSLKPLNESYIDQAIKICDQELGNDYLNYSIIKHHINNENSLILGAFTVEDKLIGFGFCSMLNNLEFKNSLHSDQYYKLPKILTEAKQIGITNTIAIENQYKFKGIGSMIFNQFISFFKTKKCTVVGGFAWKIEEGVNMEKIFLKNNFDQISIIEQYWKQDSLTHQYNCSICGVPPCKCSAVIYCKLIK